MVKVKNTKKQGNKIAGNLGLARRFLLLLISVAVVVAIGAFGFLRQRVKGSDNSNPGTGLFTVERGDLIISVTESGDIKAVKSVDIKSKVEGRNTIVNIAPEGTMITPEDVNDGKVLVELDSSKLKEQVAQKEIEFTTAEASFADANESYLIQVKQNESDVTAAELKVKFALMDFQKHLGGGIAQEVIEKMESNPNLNPDMTSLINDPNSLGGAASQQLDTLQDAILLARGNLEKASDVLEGTQKLYDANYASELELKGAMLDVARYSVQEKSALKELKLYQLYDFPKEAERYLSDYKEAERELVRTHARARSRMAQAQARLSNAEEDVAKSREDVQSKRKQVDACTIRAPAPGLVVYGTSGEPWRERERGPVREGGKVYQRQTIISLPNTSEIIVEIRVHETSVDKVRPGQHATITVDAFPDKTFQGEVLKVAPLPDSQQGFLNPDVKVYTTKVSIEGSHDSVRPGMSAKVEILVDQLDDVLIVPVLAVAIREGKKLCYVMASDTPQPRAVSTGAFNDTFVEIISGLEEGEQVLLNPPLLFEPSAVARSTEERKLPPGREPPGDKLKTNRQ